MVDTRSGRQEGKKGRKRFVLAFASIISSEARDSTNLLLISTRGMEKSGCAGGLIAHRSSREKGHRPRARGYLKKNPNQTCLFKAIRPRWKDNIKGKGRAVTRRYRKTKLQRITRTNTPEKKGERSINSNKKFRGRAWDLFIGRPLSTPHLGGVGGGERNASTSGLARKKKQSLDGRKEMAGIETRRVSRPGYSRVTSAPQPSDYF